MQLAATITDNKSQGYFYEHILTDAFIYWWMMDKNMQYLECFYAKIIHMGFIESKVTF